MLDIFLPIPCCWPDKREREIRRINSDIEKQIRRDKRESSKQYKILLLGAGESGKSTFIRHMRILHGDGFRLREREEARETVISNLVICVYLVLCQMELDKHCSDPDSARLRYLGARLQTLLTASEEREVTQHVYEMMEAGEELEEEEDRQRLLREIGDNPRFRSTLESLTLFKLPDSALYFLTRMERLLCPSFTPSTEDMIRMRRATTGIQETLLQFGEVHFRLVDVGGQRSERRKWIHCFEDVSSIIFIASLAEYNMRLVEDGAVNRLEESTALFYTILRNPWLRQSSMILFLNKKDIFDEKIRYFDLRVNFPAFTGRSCDSAEAKDFILDMFLSPVKNLRTKIYSHITIATDPDNVQFVFAAVKHTVLSSIMAEIFSSESDYLQ